MDILKPDNINIDHVLAFCDEVAQRLEESRLGVMSTVGNEGAKARTVDYINIGPNIGFFSWNHSGKVGEIEKTPEVSFCVNEVQIEGVVYIRPINDPSIGEYLKRYEVKFPDLYPKFTTLPNIIFITVEPKRIKRMMLEENALYIERCDVETGELEKEKLSDW